MSVQIKCSGCSESMLAGDDCYCDSCYEDILANRDLEKVLDAIMPGIRDAVRNVLASYFD